MSEIPDALVEKALAAWNQQQILRTGSRKDHMRAVLAAILPDLAEERRRAIDSALTFAAAHSDDCAHDYPFCGCPLPAARPVVDAARLAEVLCRFWDEDLVENDASSHSYGAPFPCPPCTAEADAILAAGVVQGAADVRRAVARRVEAFCDLREQQGHEYVRVDDVRAMVTEVGGRHE